MSATGTPGGRLDPPVQETPLMADGGQHTQAWAGWFDQVADNLNGLPAQVRQGVTDGSDAAAGNIGEYLTTTGSAVALANAVVTPVVSLSLPAGDWDVVGNVTFSAAAGTHTYFGVGITNIDTNSSATFPSTAFLQLMNTATHRVSQSATAAVNVVAQANFTATMTATGSVRARRVR